jgi:hypothetical protein
MFSITPWLNVKAANSDREPIAVLDFIFRPSVAAYNGATICWFMILWFGVAGDKTGGAASLCEQ